MRLLNEMHWQCPSVLLCAGSMGWAIGRALATLIRNRSAPGLIVLGASFQGESYAVRPVTEDESSDQEETSLENAVGSFLSIGNATLPTSADSLVKLRMVVVGQYGEMSSPLLTNLIDELNLVARRRVGWRHTIECLFYLPVELPAEQPAQGVREGGPIPSIDAATEYFNACSNAIEGSDYCWWFTSINSLGLSLPEDVCTALATLVYAVVSTAPEHYASNFDVTVARPVHLCAGYAELSVLRAEIERCLIARYVARLVRRHYLRACELNEEHMTARVRQLTNACEKVLEDVALTPGKERIWKGWDKSIPDFSSGDISGFLALQTDAMARFRESLPEVRRQGRLSATLGLQGFQERFRTDLSRIDGECGKAASACIDFIVRFAAFLIDISELDEEDPCPANIQTVRRKYDTDFAGTVHFSSDVDIDEPQQHLREARSHLSRLLRLNTISAPPALSRERWNEIHWETEGSIGLAQAISNAEKQVVEAWKEYLQSLAEKEAKMQGAIDEVTSERKGRDQAIEDAEHELQRSAEEYRRLTRKLRDRPVWSSFLASAAWTPYGRQLRRLHDRLGELRRHVLPTNALRVAEAYSNRAELEVQRILYRIRDDTVQLILKHVRSSHDDQSATISALEEISTRNSRAGLRIDHCPFARALISDDSLDSILDDVERSCQSVVDQQIPGFLNLVSHPLEEVEAVLFDRSRALLRELESRPIRYYIQATRCDLNAAVMWMRHASRPWFPYEPPQPDESVVVLADDNTWGNGPLRGTFPGAQWIGNSTSDSAAVLRVRSIGTFDEVVSLLGRRGVLSIGKPVAAPVPD